MNTYRFICPRCNHVIDLYLSNNNSGVSAYCKGRNSHRLLVEGSSKHKMVKMHMVGFPQEKAES